MVQAGQLRPCSGNYKWIEELSNNIYIQDYAFNAVNIGPECFVHRVTIRH